MVTDRTWRKLTYEGEPIHEMLPYFGYDEDSGVFINADGSLMGVAEYIPVSYAGVTNEDAIRIANALKNIFSNPDIPPGSVIQFVAYASPFFEDVMEEWVIARSHAKNELFREYVRNRFEFYKSKRKGFFPDLPIIPRHFRYFVILKVFPKEDRPVPIQSRIRGFIKQFIEGKKPLFYGISPDTVSKFAKVWRGVIASLETIGVSQDIIRVTPLSADDFLELMAEIMNGIDRSTKVHYDPKIPLSQQMLFKPMYIGKNRILIGDPRFHRAKYVSVITANAFAKYPFLKDTVNLMGDLERAHSNLSVPFLFTLNIKTLDQFKSKGALQAKQALQVMQANALAMFSAKAVLKRDEYTYALSMLEKGESLIKTDLHITLFADSYEESVKSVQIVRTLFNNAGYTPLEEDRILNVMYLESLPGYYSGKLDKFTFRPKTIFSVNAAHMTPVIADWKGTKTPALGFLTRRGQYFYFDLFDSPSSYNAFIFAESGAGKSFLANEIIMSYLSTGGRVFVIDMGHSYKKLADLVNGRYIQFKPKTEMKEYEQYINLNPFSMASTDEEGKLTPEDQSFLKYIIAKMCVGSSTSEKEKITKVELSYIEQAINRAFAKKRKSTTITNVRDELDKMYEQEKDERLRDLSKRLFSYTKDGQYSHLFEGQGNLSFSDYFTVLELEDLRGDADLQATVLSLVMFYINKAIMKGDRGQKKIVVVDEGWKLLQDEFSARFIEEGYRVYRKYNGSMITISQNIQDLFHTEGGRLLPTPTGRAVIQNSPFMFILKQSPMTLSLLRQSDIFPFPKEVFDLIGTLQVVTGKYSEFFVYTPLGQAVVKFIPDPYTYWLYTTSARDRDLFERELVRNKGDVIYTLNKLARELPHGSHVKAAT